MKFYATVHEQCLAKKKKKNLSLGVQLEDWRNKKVLSLPLLQVGGIITWVEGKGGPFLAPWKNSVCVCQPLNQITEFRQGVVCGSWVTSAEWLPVSWRGCVRHHLLPIRRGFGLLLP